MIDGVVSRRPSQAVDGGQTLAVDFSALPPPDAPCEAENIPLEIVAEDAQLLIINKPPGMVTHPGRGNRTGTLQSALLNHDAALAALPRAGLVHRLDKDTSGLLAIAKTAAACKYFLEQFKTRSVGRVYLALTHGMPPPTGVIDLPIGRSRRQPTKMAVRADGKPSVTRFVVEKRWQNHTLLRCLPETGRTHQIRLHLAHGGYPIVGDTLYRRRGQQPVLCRQALHAAELRLRHPTSGEQCEWRAPLPSDMREAIARLDANQPADG